MKRTCLLLATLFLLTTPLLARDDVLSTEVSLLIGRPGAIDTSQGVLVVPGTVIPVSRVGGESDDFRAGESSSARLLDVAEDLKRSLRLSEVEIRYRMPLHLEVDVAKDLPAPASTSDVHVSVKLLGFNDLSATYEVQFYSGSTVIADTPLTVELGQPAVVGGLDGDEAPYLFLVLEPSRQQDAVKLTDDMKPPIAIHKVGPAYPEESRKARITGAVVLQTIIDVEGRITDTKVLKSPAADLAEAAVEAIRTWRFEPARLNGEPVAVYYNLTVNFRLKKDKEKPES